MASARTKAQKLKAKRGRPRMPAAANTNREPNGRVSRRINDTEKDAMNVAVSTRIRHLGLVDKKIEGRMVSAELQAADPRRGYVLGLLLLDGRITKMQHDAGLRYSEDMARYYGLTGVPFPSTRAQSLFAVRGEAGESEGKVKAAQSARSIAKRLQSLLLSVGDIDTGRRVEHTVKSICLLDIPESRGWPEHMIEWLRRGLNKLVREHYGMEA